VHLLHQLIMVLCSQYTKSELLIGCNGPWFARVNAEIMHLQRCIILALRSFIFSHLTLERVQHKLQQTCITLNLATDAA
jgi:hypothetical protein